MKLGLFIFFLGLCLVGSIVNGKKFVQENETVLIEDCEPSDTDESEVTLSFFSALLSGTSVVNFQEATRSSYPFGFLAVKQIALDSFFPPPDFSTFC